MIGVRPAVRYVVVAVLVGLSIWAWVIYPPGWGALVDAVNIAIGGGLGWSLAKRRYKP